MRSVNVADLKARLSEYLQAVRRGEELIIKNRNRPIARVSPIANGVDGDAERSRLIAEGKLVPGKRRSDAAFWREFWSLPRPKLDWREGVKYVLAQRAEEEREEDKFIALLGYKRSGRGLSAPGARGAAARVSKARSRPRRVVGNSSRG